ncbi:MAG: hypothetical protein A3H96_09150 [Acidobacteria bacterium RIFCSPLOWO2_02_FULL_67_36]|nr:MAG: hypothetical protein A3H96_09150 [Acidobacteria bacterium RIFCSPLOWO2_02_FULL_67_36]OFW25057.1 MAG: hypothetical protein A3G21_16585 [Acidobacteria bacterium RIFCSPLOWO2_12_FULL_66_21]
MRAAARARASRALRALDAEAEYAGLGAFRTLFVDRVTVEDGLLVEGLPVGRFWAPSTGIGRHTPRPSRTANTRATDRGRIRATSPP